MLKKVEEQIIKSLKKYLKKQGRVGFDLKELNELLRNGPQIRQFFGVFKNCHSLLGVFKIFLLAHRIAFEGTQSQSNLVDLVTLAKYEPSDDFQKLLASKFMEPYRLYLQKRVVLYSQGLSLTKKDQRQARVYQLINLITLATSFSDLIYTFGRYYMDKFTCAIDFNIILGADLQLIYQEMIDNVTKPASKHILYEIESIHEKMYVVYYNCYFHRYLKSYIPKWVITDLLAHRRYQTPQKDSTKSTLSRTGTSKLRCLSSTKHKTNSFSTKKKNVEDDLGESNLFLNAKGEEEVENVEDDVDIFKSSVVYSPESDRKQKQMEIQMKRELKKQEDIDLLKSMERVMQVFNRC